MVFTGGVYGQGYRELQSHAWLYVHATEVGGTHPALVEAMGFGNCVIVNDVPENREVAGDAALYFDARRPATLASLLERLDDDPDLVGLPAAARRRPRAGDLFLGPHHRRVRAPFPADGSSAEAWQVISERARVVTAFYVASDTVATHGGPRRRARAREALGSLDGVLGPVYPLARYLPLLLVILPLWGVIFYASGLYGARALRTLRTEVSRLARALAIGAAAAVHRHLRREARLRQPPAHRTLPAAQRPVRRAGPQPRPRARGRERHAATRAHCRRARRGARSRRPRVDAHRDWGLEIVGFITDGSWRDPGRPAPPGARAAISSSRDWCSRARSSTRCSSSPAAGPHRRDQAASSRCCCASRNWASSRGWS